jgi:hypothetical protein
MNVFETHYFLFEIYIYIYISMYSIESMLFNKCNNEMDLGGSDIPLENK